MSNTYHETVAVATKFYAAHGAALFPIPYGKKAPAGYVKSWLHEWSRDPAQWAAWREQYPDCNFGVVAFASKWITLDTDIKPTDGQSNEDACADAAAQRRALLESWGMNPDTLPHVQSAHGGWHDHFAVPEHIDAATLKQPDAIKKRINVRVRGYTVAAGSYYDGTEKNDAPGWYQLYDGAAAPHPAPAALLEHCAPAKPREHVAKLGSRDRDDVGKLIDWLNQRGGFDAYEDWCALGMALKLECGDDAKELWALSHNDTVTEDVIESKWESFASEATSSSVTLNSFMKRAHNLGWTGTIRQSTASMFAGVAQLAKSPSIVPTLAPGTPGPQVLAEDEESYPTPPGGFMQRLGDRLKNFVLPQYLWDGVLIKGFVYSLTAQTGAGKTATALLFAAHVALGKALCSRDVEKGSVIYFAGENPDDVDMRWLGLCHLMGLDPDTLDVHIVPGVVPLSMVADRIRQECEAKRLRPSAVIVDTAAAYFEGDDDNGNVAMGNYARQLRALSTLPGEPCVLVLAHPTKGAKDINEMVPRGGGAFLNEMDGNLAAARGDGNLIGIQAVGKFRGPEFTPMHFALIPVHDCPALFDPKKGRFLPTVAAQPVSEAGAAARASEGEQDDIRLLRDIETHPRDDLRKRAPRLGCHHVTVGRRIEKLAKRKMVDDTGIMVRLTAKGQKELNALDTVQQGATSVVPFPVPGRP